MMPILFRIPGLERDVPAFGVMMTIGFLLAIWWAVRRSIRSGANPDVVLNMGFIALIAGVVGCRVMYVVHYWEDQFAPIADPVARFWAAINLTSGGMEFYGGFIASLVCTLAYLWISRHSIRWYLDIVAPSVAVGMAFGRIGCFLNGCCWGGTCELPWAMRFPYGSNPQIAHWDARLPEARLPEELIVTTSRTGAAAFPMRLQHLSAPESSINAAVEQERALRAELARLNEQVAAAAADQRTALQAESNEVQRRINALPFADVRQQMRNYGLSVAELRKLADAHPSLPVHPAQLYSTAGLLVLAFFLSALYWRRTRDGQVIFTMLLIEPVSRWLLETIRSDNPQDTFGFTISQAIAMTLTLIGLIGLLWLRTQPPRSPRATWFVPPPEAPVDSKKKPAAAS